MVKKRVHEVNIHNWLTTSNKKYFTMASKDSDDIVILKPGKATQDKSINLQLKEKNLKEQAKKARDLFESMELPQDLKDGLSFLDLKNDTLLSYMIDLCNILLIKSKNKSIEGHPSVERTVEYRVILEKIRGIDQKLSYQVNKLLTLSALDPSGTENERMNLDDFDLE